jgi:hypothetical protein
MDLSTLLQRRSGIATCTLRGITFGSGVIYTTDVGNSQIYAVDPPNGNRSIVSGAGVGGTTFNLC